MGNTESVLVQKRLGRFRPEERPLVEAVFTRLHGEGSAGKTAKVLKLDTLQRSMGDLVPEPMVRRVYAAMCSMESGDAAGPNAGLKAGPEAGVSREQLVVFLADVLRGTAEERAPVVMAMARGTGVATCDQITELLQDLLTAMLQILTTRGRLQGWQPDRMGDCSLGVKLLAEQMISELKPSGERVCDQACVEDWVFRVPQVAAFLELLVSEGLGVALGHRPPSPLPPCRDTPWASLGPASCLLDLPCLLFLGPRLPEGTGAPWRLLFSTRLHGESFSRVIGCCTKKGPTLLLVRDTRGHVFGGFASTPWELKPQFQGDSRCFLFSVSPCLRVFTCTGYNQHYMYLNTGQQTMPNGLGMGGQHGYFGLWLDSDFGRGHSRARPRCTTYGSPQLSADEDFTLDVLEVWEVGRPPQDPDQDPDQRDSKRSVLDADPDVQAMMEMAGKTRHSEGLREPEEED